MFFRRPKPAKLSVAAASCATADLAASIIRS
jgi:hypothetical protein